MSFLLNKKKLHLGHHNRTKNPAWPGFITAKKRGKTMKFIKHVELADVSITLLACHYA
jgi:hypothetical protein